MGKESCVCLDQKGEKVKRRKYIIDRRSGSEILSQRNGDRKVDQEKERKKIIRKTQTKQKEHTQKKTKQSNPAADKIKY